MRQTETGWAEPERCSATVSSRKHKHEKYSRGKGYGILLSPTQKVDRKQSVGRAPGTSWASVGAHCGKDPLHRLVFLLLILRWRELATIDGRATHGIQLAQLGPKHLLWQHNHIVALTCCMCILMAVALERE